MTQHAQEGMGGARSSTVVPRRTGGVWQSRRVQRRIESVIGYTLMSALALVFLVWGGAEIYVAANLLAPELGISVSWTIFGICIVVSIYATLGGFRAVVATDKLQYIIVVLYILSMTWLAVDGLWEETHRILPVTDTLTLKSDRPWNDLVGPGLFTIIILVFLLTNSFNSSISSNQLFSGFNFNNFTFARNPFGTLNSC